jgi:hypothetical protein
MAIILHVWKPNEVIDAATALVKAGEWDKIDPTRLIEALRFASLISAGRVDEVPLNRLCAAVEARRAVRGFSKAVLAARRGPTVRRTPTVRFRMPPLPPGGDFRSATRILAAATAKMSHAVERDPLNAPTLDELIGAGLREKFPDLSRGELANAMRRVRDAEPFVRSGVAGPRPRTARSHREIRTSRPVRSKRRTRRR